MTLRQLAFRNVSRNKRTYAAFFLSSTFSVMIFFIYALFIFHPALKNSGFNWSAFQAMKAAAYIVYAFSIFFVLYSVSAFLKSRKREFGVLIVHGMTCNQLRQIAFIESMTIGFASIVSGLAAGMLFAKLFMMIGADAMRMSPLPYYMPGKAILLTLSAFMLLFLVISVFTAAFVRASKPIDLLKGSAKPKPEPKSSVFLSVAACCLLLAGYVISFLVKGVTVVFALLPVTVLVIIGTYLLYTQLSVFVIHTLRSNRSVFLRKTNVLVLSDMVYRLKDNAHMFFLVTIVSTAAICAMGGLLGFLTTIHKQVSDAYPFAYSYIQTTGNAGQAAFQTKIIEQALEKRGIRYNKLAVRIANFDSIKGQPLNFIRLSDYTKLAQALDYPALSLQGNEAAAIWTMKNRPFPDQEWSVKGTSVTLAMTQTVGKAVTPPLGDEPLLIVQDRMLDSLGKPQHEQLLTVYATDSADSTADTGAAIAGQLGDAQNSDYGFASPAYLEEQMKRTYNLMLFVGLFVSCLFFIASGSFLYFRLFTDLNDDKQKYRSLTKLGLTDKELEKVANLQMALLFFMPLAVAFIHSSVALYALHNLLHAPVTHSAVKVCIVFLAAQFLYFLLIRARYLKHLKDSVRFN
ncbi:putative ABC transport system permease protein [Paenibacillus sp. UNCCL117]|uniref:FtsX-like permease family protein n=1 Tax=unclassified Paenibacillus TaxID=185978 RepID=UPI000888DF2E|nr:MULTISPECIES: ABC transporter permease [unclassified Paenibacillus]SDE15447.1 putative ABC transport system permease protein [Paenibacillus sp. cl123]SFW60899.1 putative ABC transport system permease protein [Paenibacillus sp. UNCCL117]